MGIRRLLKIIKKEFIQLGRDRRLLPMVLMMPIIQLFIIFVTCRFLISYTSFLKPFFRLLLIRQRRVPKNYTFKPNFSKFWYFHFFICCKCRNKEMGRNL